MSLINQVLKDLEKRHAGADASGLARALRPLPEERTRLGVWITCAVIAIALAAGGGWWWTMRDRIVPVLVAKKIPAAQSTPIPGAVPQPAPQPSQPVLAKVDATAAVAAPVATNPAPVSAAALPATGPSSATSTPVSAPAVQLPVGNAASKDAESSPSQRPASASRMDHAVAVNQMSAPLAPVVPAAGPAPGRRSLALPSGGLQDKTNITTPSNPQPLQPTDTEASPAKPSPTPAHSKPVPVVQASPKIVASARSVESSEVKTPSEDPNIEKQVRPQTDRERAEDKFRQGMNALQNGRVAEAESALSEALRIDPMADNARQALLSMYVEAGRRDEAEKLLEDRLQVDHKHFGFAMALARLQLERGKNAEALATLQRSVSVGETNADYQAMFANALARVARHKEAAERFAVAARLAPRNPLWQMGLGMELRAESRNAEARAAFQRARELGGLNAQLTAYLDQQLRELQ